MSTIKKAVMPVAGFGTRFLPATKAQPKEMLPLVDKPIIQYLVEEAVASGIEDIIFVTSQTKRAIEDHFDRNFELEYRLQQGNKKKQLAELNKIFKMAQFIYVRQATPKGWGDAVLQAEHIVGQQPFAVLLGDGIVDSPVPALKQMMPVYAKYKGSVIGVNKVEPDQVINYGVIKPKKVANKTYQVFDIIEKPQLELAPSHLAATGRYLFTPDIFPALRKLKPKDGQEITAYDAFRPAMAKGQVYAYVCDGKFFDCGNKLEYLKATVHFGLKHKDLQKDFKKYLKDRKF